MTEEMELMDALLHLRWLARDDERGQQALRVLMAGAPALRPGSARGVREVCRRQRAMWKHVWWVSVDDVLAALEEQ